jgi:uncharacterized protein YdaU (DUF1376 family)
MGQRDVPDWFSFYVYEFMSDERVVAMTLEQVGAYVLLMLGQWINGSIPADVPALAAILKRTPEDMAALWAGIAPCFQPHPEKPGRLVQCRLERERAETIARMEKTRERERQRREAARAKQETRTRVDDVRARVDTTDTRSAHVSEPCTVLSLISIKDSKKEATGENCDTFRELYPAHRLDNLGAQLFISSDDQAGILARLRLAVKSEDWTRENGRYVPKASKWIDEGAPAPAAQPTPASAPASVVSTMDPETARRIREARNG